MKISCLTITLLLVFLSLYGKAFCMHPGITSLEQEESASPNIQRSSVSSSGVESPEGDLHTNAAEVGPPTQDIEQILSNGSSLVQISLEEKAKECLFLQEKRGIFPVLLDMSPKPILQAYKFMTLSKLPFMIWKESSDAENGIFVWLTISLKKTIRRLKDIRNYKDYQYYFVDTKDNIYHIFMDIANIKNELGLTLENQIKIITFSADLTWMSRGASNPTSRENSLNFSIISHVPFSRSLCSSVLDIAIEGTSWLWRDSWRSSSDEPYNEMLERNLRRAYEKALYTWRCREDGFESGVFHAPSDALNYIEKGETFTSKLTTKLFGLVGGY